MERTITIEDEEFEDLRARVETLELELSNTRDEKEDLNEELHELRVNWNDRNELLKRIGELS